eukprot:scaffold2212_cov167-Ochromonas_danica.AAC.2
MEMLLLFWNNTLKVSASNSVAQTERAINILLGSKASAFINGTGVICGENSSVVTSITISTQVGGIPLWTVASSNLVEAQVFPLVNSIDKVGVVDGDLGMYYITYTPTIAGVYDIWVKISGFDVANDEV